MAQNTDNIGTIRFISSSIIDNPRDKVCNNVVSVLSKLHNKLLI